MSITTIECVNARRVGSEKFLWHLDNYRWDKNVGKSGKVLMKSEDGSPGARQFLHY